MIHIFPVSEANTIGRHSLIIYYNPVVTIEMYGYFVVSLSLSEGDPLLSTCGLEHPLLITCTGKILSKKVRVQMAEYGISSMSEHENRERVTQSPNKRVRVQCITSSSGGQIEYSVTQIRNRHNTNKGSIK